MADNAQKTPIARSIGEAGRALVLEHIQNSSAGAIPAILVSLDATNTIAVVQPQVQGVYNLPPLTVAIEGDEYTRRPWKAGDKGTLTAHAVSIGGMTGLRAAAASTGFTHPGNLAGLVWKPVGNANFKPALDKTAHETYGGTGGTINHDGTATSMVRTHKTNGSSLSTGGDGSGAEGPHSVTAHPENGVGVASTIAHTIAAPNASLDKEGNLAAQQNITSTAGNISAPAGAISALSGALGGLKMLAGIMSGGGASGGPPAISIDTNAGVVAVAAYIQTRPMLFANLPAASATLVGARACITDCTVSAFLAVAAGGGTVCVPVFCQQVAGPAYRWVVG